jgi:hypothetical protein
MCGRSDFFLAVIDMESIDLDDAFLFCAHLFGPSFFVDVGDAKTV